MACETLSVEAKAWLEPFAVGRVGSWVRVYGLQCTNRDNEGTQLDYAQLHDRVVCSTQLEPTSSAFKCTSKIIFVIFILQGMELLHCVNEAGVALGEDEGSGSSEKSLRKTMKVYVTSIQKPPSLHTFDLYSSIASLLCCRVS